MVKAFTFKTRWPSLASEFKNYLEEQKMIYELSNDGSLVGFTYSFVIWASPKEMKKAKAFLGYRTIHES